MTKYVTLILIVFCSFHLLPLPGSCQTLFSKRVNSSYQEFESCAIISADHSAIISASRATSLTSSSIQMGLTITKTDTSGNIIWRKNYDPFKSKWIMVPTVILEQNYGYLIGGILFHSKGDVMLLKIDPDGNILDFNRLHPVAEHHPVMNPDDMVVRPDGALIMTGIAGLGHEHSEILWMRTTDDFSSYTVKSIGSVKDLAGIKVFAEPNNKTILAVNNGNVFDNTNDNNTAFPALMKLDAAGNVLNTINYKLPFQANLNDCIRLQDGSFVMVGTGISQSYILKINSAFDLVWYRSYPIANNYSYLTKVFNRVTATADGGFIISGSQDIAGQDTKEYSMLMKTDALGLSSSYSLSQGSDNQRIVSVSPISSATLMANGLDESASIIFKIGTGLETSCPFVGNAVSSTSGTVLKNKNNALESTDFVNSYILETGNLTVSDDGLFVDYCSPLREEFVSTLDNEKLLLYPNPANREVNITLPSSFRSENNRIAIISLMGQQLKQYQVLQEASTSINIDWLLPGYYFIKVTSETGKIATASFQVF